MNQGPLSIPQILRWSDAYREKSGSWPHQNSGPIAGTIGETWRDADTALRRGLRGLPGASSLARLLAEERGARNLHSLSPLSEAQILNWADVYHRQTGTWPTAKSGKIADSSGETWAGVSAALLVGKRGLSGGSSLARLLARHRGVRNRSNLPSLSDEQILEWADAHHARHGVWPSARPELLESAEGETWPSVAMALQRGHRGLSGGSPLAFLLAEQRGVRNVWTRPDLSVTQILAWADAHHGRTNRWPTVKSGPIQEASAETWQQVDRALRRG